MCRCRLIFWLRSFGRLALAAGALASAARAGDEAARSAFTDRHCSSCHNDIDREGGLDLTSLRFAPDDPDNLLTWVRVHDRVHAGEMPPPEKPRPAAGELGDFVRGLGDSLIAAERTAVARDGRAPRRRLNREEYENVLRDVLETPWLQVQAQLPEEGEAHRFNKLGQALEVSYVHLARYLTAAELAIRQAMQAGANRPKPAVARYYARAEPDLTDRFYSVIDGTPSQDRRTFPVLGTAAQPEVRMMKIPMTAGEGDLQARELEAVGWVHSHYQTAFNSVWTNFTAPANGRYRVRFSGYTLWVGPNGFRRETVGTGMDKHIVERPRRWHQPNFDEVSPGRRDEAITVYSHHPAGNRRLGTFDLTPEPAVNELEVFLFADESLITDAARFYRSRPTGAERDGAESYFTNPLAQRDGAPAVAFRWMEVEGPLDDDTTGAGHRVLFGDLPTQFIVAPESGADDPPAHRVRSRRGNLKPVRPAGRVEAITTQPLVDAQRLLRAFLDRAYRRPVDEAEVGRFVALFRSQFQAEPNFTEAMITAYSAVLASPGLVFLDEQPGPLDDHALATRLAFFLWNSAPDAALQAEAARGNLHRPEVLHAQAERMLSNPKAQRFFSAFLDYWLDLRKMDDTSPSTTLYNDYYLDDALTEAAREETRLFFSEMVQRDLPARTIVDSDFTFLNERLARHYGIPGVAGGAMRRVALPAGSVRGGLLTQASVLKVTANGTTTSPVVRGKWIRERILGLPTPLPPAAVPAVEPDIRGAVTIREQLARHRADESCAGCHRNIDPPGFALESFDVMGGWRERYRATSTESPPEPGFGKNGWPLAFHLGPSVDASGVMPDGRAFRDIRDFKRLLLEDEAQIARNFAEELVVFATGAPVRFSDRAAIETILHATKAGGYGARGIIHAILEHEIFRNK